VIDRHYVKIANFGLDLRILVCTFLRMIGVRHGRAARWLRVTCDMDQVVETRATESRPHWQKAVATLESDDADGLAVVAVGNGDVTYPTTITESSGGIALSPRRAK
jgi:hypothetical protein